jgi:hypothetical protein
MDASITLIDFVRSLSADCSDEVLVREAEPLVALLRAAATAEVSASEHGLKFHLVTMAAHRFLIAEELKQCEQEQ